MPAITPITDPSGFSVEPQTLDWGVDADSGQPIIGVPVSGLTDVYVAAGGAVVVNDNGMSAFAQDTTVLNVNLRAGETMLAADDPPAATMPDATPIKLSFSAPVKEIGAYVTVLGDATLWRRQLHAFLWLRLQSGPAWHPTLPAIGTIGPTLPRNAQPTAAFVGARVEGGDAITGAKFDAKLLGKRTFSQLIISKLFWVA